MARWLPFVLLAIPAVPGRSSETRASLAASWNDPSVPAAPERRSGRPFLGLVLDHPSKRCQVGLGLSLSFDPRAPRPAPGV